MWQHYGGTGQDFRMSTMAQSERELLPLVRKQLGKRFPVWVVGGVICGYVVPLPQTGVSDG